MEESYTLKRKRKLFKYIYFSIAILLYTFAFPFLLLLTTKKKYRVSIPKRFFPFNNPKPKTDTLFHACSVGEVNSIEPILKKLDKKISISTITQTGNNQAKKLTEDVKYLPFELFLPFWLNVKTLVVIEAELWYMLFLVAKTKGAKTILVNARVSEKSYPKYLKLKWFYKKIFANIDIVFAQSEADKKRLSSLGAKNIKVIGNIKLAKEIKATKNYIKPKSETITLASSHEGEEKLILDTFLKIQNPNQKLIIVPRHPERFDRVDELIQKSLKDKSLTYSRFSKKQNFESDIVLIDCLGELINIYAISDTVIMGGTFAKIGGHNVIEPASFNCKIISGKHYFSQKELYKMVESIEITDNLEQSLNSKNLKKSKILQKIEIDEIIKEIK